MKGKYTALFLESKLFVLFFGLEAESFLHSLSKQSQKKKEMEYLEEGEKLDRNSDIYSKAACVVFLFCFFCFVFVCARVEEKKSVCQIKHTRQEFLWLYYSSKVP